MTNYHTSSSDWKRSRMLTCAALRSLLFVGAISLVGAACGSQDNVGGTSSDPSKDASTQLNPSTTDIDRMLKVREAFPESYRNSLPTDTVLTEADIEKNIQSTANTVYFPDSCKGVDNLISQLQPGERTTALNVVGDGQLFLVTVESSRPGRKPVPASRDECVLFQIDRPTQRGSVTRPDDTPRISEAEIRGYHTIAVSKYTKAIFEEYRYYAWLANGRVVSVILTEDPGTAGSGAELNNSIAINVLRRAISEFK